MTDHEHHRQRLLHFARIRRLKSFLRYMPRRARFHTYPVVGRFAAFARARSYLWSFRYEQLRSAFYAGSILSFMPAVGVQLPVAFVLCLLLRTNFMIAGGLQFITNPVTMGPIYYGTYKLGSLVLHHSGWGPAEAVPPAPVPSLQDSASIPHPPAAVSPEPGQELIGNWLGDLASQFNVDNLTYLFNGLVIGGLIVGATFGALLDLIWRKLIMPAARHHAARKPVTANITPHDDSRPPLP
ncbi:MAG: DUF2062 domain-containing protein [Opitutaceae bacterium]|jgi:hypothetical protein|nr:DUF2062 domain-containing protein [Opitutaceae bacterium]